MPGAVRRSVFYPLHSRVTASLTARPCLPNDAGSPNTGSSKPTAVLDFSSE